MVDPVGKWLLGLVHLVGFPMQRAAQPGMRVQKCFGFVLSPRTARTERGGLCNSLAVAVIRQEG